MPVLVLLALVLIVVAVAGGLAVSPFLWVLLIVAALILVFGTLR